MRTTQIHVDAEKDYVFLSLKKWYSYADKEELIPKLRVEFYASDSTKISKIGIKKATLLQVVCEDSRVNDCSFEVYVARLRSHLAETFIKIT